MGYYMNLTDQVFCIKAENKDKALESIKKLADTVQENGGGGSSTGERWYSWVDTNDFVKAKTLQEAFNAWRWGTDENEDGDVNYVYFNGEKLGDESYLFGAIAPFVEPHSFIQMTGEDGHTWRYKFDGEKMIECCPQIIWD